MMQESEVRWVRQLKTALLVLAALVVVCLWIRMGVGQPAHRRPRPDTAASRAGYAYSGVPGSSARSQPARVPRPLSQRGPSRAAPR